MNDPPQRLLYTNTIATRPCVGRPSLSVRHEHEDNLLVVNFFLKKIRITLLIPTRHIRQTFLRGGFHAQNSNERRQAMLNPSGANVKINASHPTQIQESDPNDRLCIYCSRVSCIQRQ